MDNQECPVCYDDLKTKLYIPMDCHHNICMECNEKMENRTCPICRRDIFPLITKKEYICCFSFLIIAVIIFNSIIIFKLI